MYKVQAVKYFGSQKKMANKLGVSQSAVSQWSSLLNPLRAAQIHLLTGGRLTYDPQNYVDNEQVSK